MYQGLKIKHRMISVGINYHGDSVIEVHGKLMKLANHRRIYYLRSLDMIIKQLKSECYIIEKKRKAFKIKTKIKNIKK